MNLKNYKITCLKCKGCNNAEVKEYPDGFVSINLDKYHRKNPDNIKIISGRKRDDGELGWSCICGNTSIIAKSEKPLIPDLVVNGGEDAIKYLANSLKVSDEKKFTCQTL